MNAIATKSELAALASAAVIAGRVQMSLDRTVVTLDGNRVRCARIACALGEALIALKGW